MYALRMWEYNGDMLRYNEMVFTSGFTTQRYEVEDIVAKLGGSERKRSHRGLW